MGVSEAESSFDRVDALNTWWKSAGSITFATDFTQLGDSFAVVSYSVDGEPRVQRVQIDAVPRQFGGHKLFWRRLLSGRLCLTLGYANGRFASRKVQRLTYAVQSEDALGRIRRARDKAEASACDQDGYPRPRGEPGAAIQQTGCACTALSRRQFQGPSHDVSAGCSSPIGSRDDRGRLTGHSTPP